jgi:hypothetical protein
MTKTEFAIRKLQGRESPEIGDKVRALDIEENHFLTSPEVGKEYQIQGISETNYQLLDHKWWLKIRFELVIDD